MVCAQNILEFCLNLCHFFNKIKYINSGSVRHGRRLERISQFTLVDCGIFMPKRNAPYGCLCHMAAGFLSFAVFFYKRCGCSSSKENSRYAHGKNFCLRHRRPLAIRFFPFLAGQGLLHRSGGAVSWRVRAILPAVSAAL